MKLIRVMMGVLLLTIVIGTLMVALATGSPAITADANGLPPRPNRAKENMDAAGGAMLRLELDFGDRWEDFGGEWGQIWTVVQWQNAAGDWVTVPGWQGSLDAVERTEAGGVVREKSWWVSKADLGSADFRWQVFTSQGGQVLSSSDSFDLPAQTGWTVLVDEVLD